MKRYSCAKYLLILLLTAGTSCHTSFRTGKMEYSNYRLTAETPKDSSALALLRPYSEEVSRTMNDVVGTLEVTLEKSQPESSLGDWMADAYLEIGRAHV